MGILFKNTAFLYALSLIAIPIIIHLFNFKRYKTVYFSDISFLESIKKKSKSTSQLKHLIVLISRILFIISLVLIFAQPYIPLENTSVSNTNSNITIYIDNSFSSSGENTNGKILDIEKKKAISIASAYKRSTKFLLLSNGLIPHHNRFVDFEQFTNYVSEINITNKSLNINRVIEINKDLTPNINDNKLFIISDFQNSFIAEIDAEDTISNISLIPVEVSESNNISIDSCWFETPFRKFNAEEKVFVKLKSYSKNNYSEIPIKLYINDSLRTLSSFNIEAEETKTIELNYKNTGKGFYNAEIRIDDYPIGFDNSLFFSYNIESQINILIIEDNKSNYIEKLFATEKYFHIEKQNISNVSYSKFNKYNLIILDNISEFSSGLTNELYNFYNSNGNITLIPIVENKYIDNYKHFLQKFGNQFTNIDTTSKKMEVLNTNSFIIKNIFTKIDTKTSLPIVTRNYTIHETGIEPIIKFENNSLALLNIKNKGNLYVFSFNSSNKNNISFIKSPLMLPVFFNMAFTSVKHRNLYYNLNNSSINLNYKLPNNVSIKNKTTDFIPEINNYKNNTSINIANNILQAGHFNILNKEEIIGNLAFNFDRTESNMSFKNSSDLQKIIVSNNLKKWAVINANNEHLTQKIKLSNEGKQLWYYFLIFAIIFITIEIILLRFFNKNNLPF